METVNKHTVIDLKPYPPVLAVVCNKEQHEALQLEYQLSDFGYYDADSQPIATTFCFSREKSPHRLIIIEFYAHSFIEPKTFAHEAVHVMSFIMDYVGLKYDVDNDEWYAYMLDFIFESVSNAYNKYASRDDDKTAPATIETYNHPQLALDL